MTGIDGLDSQRDTLFGIIVAKLALRQLDESKPNAKPMLQLVGFTQEVVTVAVRELLNAGPRKGAIKPPRVVVAGVSAELVPIEAMIDAKKTLTWYRDHPKKYGTIFVPVGSPADAESLGALFAIRDGEVLLDDPSADNPRWRRDLINKEAWKLKAFTVQFPELLHNQIDSVFLAVKSARRAVPATSEWVEFVLEVTHGLITEGTTVDVVSAQHSLASSLHLLGMFPDDHLFDESTTVALKKRIERNRNLSNHCKPDGTELNDVDAKSLVDASVRIRGLANQMTPDRLKALRRKLEKFAGGDEEIRSQLQLSEWEKLFETMQQQRRLGKQIVDYFTTKDSDRVEEFKELQIEEGLDANDRGAAEQLISAQKLDSQTETLFGLLPANLQRRVERLAINSYAPPDPLLAVLTKILAIERPDKEETIVLLRETGDAGSAILSRRLFALLFGPTLLEIVINSQDAGFGELKLQVDMSIAEVDLLKWPDPEQDESEEEDARRKKYWAQIGFEILVDEVVVDEFAWDPLRSNLIAFGRLLQEAVDHGRVKAESLEQLESAASFDSPFNWLDHQPIGGDSERWASTRGEWLRKLAGGLSWTKIEDYADLYTAALSEARTSLVLTGAPNNDLEALLDFDIGELGPETSAMLATHPIRLRWYGSYLNRFTVDISKALVGEFKVSTENEGLYFDSMERLSPLGQPPLLAPKATQIHVSQRESGFHEEFTIVRSEDTVHQSRVDDDVIKLMVDQADRYISEYPHKQDGLAILLLNADGDARVAAALAKGLQELKGLGKFSEPPAIQFHVCCPEDKINEVAAELEQFDVADGGPALLPRLQILLHRWNPDGTLRQLDHLLGRIDVALAPDVFGRSYKVNTQTRAAESHGAGVFDRLFEPTTHAQESLVSSGPGLASTRVLLPASPDSLLESWSTLAVRRYRSAPVSVSSPENTDYLTMQIDFAGREDLFLFLHGVAHWLVTIDQFVGRDQIDAVSERPDVIMVRDGVGKNHSYTLVVSSNSGKKFVVDRLARRLQTTLDLVGDEETARDAASRVYEIGRNIAPGIMLRALGLGRTTEEIVGLVVARRRISEIEPVSSLGGLEAWLCLDDYTQWFGGPQRTRADLLRLCCVQRDGEMLIHAQVIESKFRRDEDFGNAVEQVERTIALVRDMIGDPGEQTEPGDRDLWLRELAMALRQLPKATQSPEDLPSLVIHDGPETTDLGTVVSNLTAGAYRVQLIDGVICATNSTSRAEDEIKELKPDLRLLRVGRPSLLHSLQGVTAKSGLAVTPKIRSPLRPEVPTGDPTKLTTQLAAEGSSASMQDSSPDGDMQTDSVIETEQVGTQEIRGEPLIPTSDTERESTPGMSVDELTTRYQEALDTFAAFKVGVEQPPQELRYEQGPGFFILRFRPKTEVGVQGSTVASRTEDLKLKLCLTQDQTIRSYTDRGFVVFEVPKSSSQRYMVNASDLWSRAEWPVDGLFAPIGEDISGSLVGINFSSSSTPHLLIAGTTGSGKSVALETILEGLCLHYSAGSLRLHLVDPKGTELVGFEESPHLEGDIGWDAEDAIGALELLVDEMQARGVAFRGQKVRSLVEFNQKITPDERKPWHLLVLDEYADLTTDKEDRKTIEALLQRLAQKGRSAGIHIVVATQRPSADIITPVIRSNLPAQLALRVRSAVDSRIILDEAGAESLAGQGDALFRTPDGIIRIQCAMVRR